jgi:hypothetical protein
MPVEHSGVVEWVNNAEFSTHFGTSDTISQRVCILPPKWHSKKGKDSNSGFFVTTRNRQLYVCTGEHLYVPSCKTTIMEYFSKHLQPTPQFYQHIPCAGCK